MLKHKELEGQVSDVGSTTLRVIYLSESSELHIIRVFHYITARNQRENIWFITT